MPAFKVDSCKKDDVDGLLRFFDSIRSVEIPFLPSDKEEVSNKYRKYGNDHDELNLFLLKDNEGRVIGCSGYVPFKGMLCGREFNGFMGSDAIIDKKLRSQFPLLAMMLARRYEKLVRDEKILPLVYPANKAVSKAFKNVQWGQFTYIYKLTSDFVANLRPDISSSSIELRKINAFDVSTTHFFKKISPQHNFFLNCDINSLNWKYFRNPHCNYVVLTAMKNDQMLGYIVAEKRYSDIYIVDITVDLDHQKTILLLLFEVFKHFEIGEISPVVVYLSHKKYIEIFTKAGFFNMWEIECLYFKVGLLFSSLDQGAFHEADKSLFHFNGFVPHLY